VTKDVDELYQVAIPLAEKPVDKVTADEALELAGWYLELEKKAVSPVGRAVALNRVRDYYEKFLSLYTKGDKTKLKAKISLESVKKQLKKHTKIRRPSRKILGQDGKVYAVAAPSARLNLMAGVDLAKDVVAGVWKADGGAVVSDTGSCSRIMLPYEVPEEYDYRVDFTRNIGASTVGIMLVKGERTFVLETGWPAGWTGFAYIDGKHIDTNSSGVKFPITNGRRYSFLVQVRNTGLRAFVDGRQIIGWKTDYKNLTPHTSWALPNKQCVGFGSYLSTTTFHSASLIEITGNGKRLR